jgi:nitrile hydratase accessory protein
LSAPDPQVLAMSLPRLPRDEDGPVFAEPWQAQAFALALQLHAQSAFTWVEWAQALSERLKAAGPEDDGSRYYEHWLTTLEGLVKANGLVAEPELTARKQAWADAYRHTPHGKPVELGAGA